MNQTKNIQLPLHLQLTKELSIDYKQTIDIVITDLDLAGCIEIPDEYCPITKLAKEEAGCLWFVLRPETRQAWINTVRIQLEATVEELGW